MKTWLLLFLLPPFLMGSIHTQEPSLSLGDEFGVSAVRDSLPEEVQEIGGNLTLDGSYDGTGALERLWNRFLLSLVESVRDSAGDALAIFALVLFCAVGGALTQGQRQEDFVQIAACAAVSIMLADGVNSLVGTAFSTLSDLSAYAKAALPAIYSAAAAGGAPASSSARYAVSCLALDLMMSAAQRILLPLLSAYIAMAICGSMFDNPILRSGLKISKKAATLLMSLMTTALTALLAVSGMVSGSADAAAVKTAKTVISATLPVVGGIMSDAASSVLAAAGLIRSTAGAFGLVSVCALCLSPFAVFAVKKLLFSLAAVAAEMTAGPRLSRLLGDMAGVMGLLLGMVGCFGLMLFFSIVSAMRAVTG